VLGGLPCGVLRVLAVEGYRSLRHLVLPLGPLTVVTGANGSGKSSLYRSLRLLADTARGGAVGALAREGGLPSTLWAGPEAVGQAVREGTYPVQGTVRTRAVSLRLGFAGDDFGYAIDFGLPAPHSLPSTLFMRDPEIKREAVWSGPVLRPSALLVQRAGGAVMIRNDSGGWQAGDRRVRSGDSMLSEVADPFAAPEVLEVRELVRSWRFYDGFRTDVACPVRSNQVGTFTPVLDPDGGDLAAALQTLRESGPGGALDDAVDRAFPGSRVEVVADEAGVFRVQLRQHGLLRPLGAAELSDGTLRYLAVGGGAAEPTAARPVRGERAGDQPPPRAATGPRAPDRRGQHARAGHRGHPLGGAARRTGTSPTRAAAPRSCQGVRRDLGRRPGAARRACVELACALTSAGRFADTALRRAVGAALRLVVGPFPIRGRPTRRRR